MRYILVILLFAALSSRAVTTNRVSAVGTIMSGIDKQYTLLDNSKLLCFTYGLIPNNTAGIYIRGCTPVRAGVCSTNGCSTNACYVYALEGNSFVLVSVYNDACNICIAQIPIMSNSNAPSGLATANCAGLTSTTNTTFAWRAFVPDDGTTYFWSGTNATLGTPEQWLQYRFDSPIVINKYSFINFEVGGTWTFSGSTDGINFVVYDTQIENLSTEFFTNTIPNITAYSYYRISFTNGSVPFVSSMQMYNCN